MLRVRIYFHFEYDNNVHAKSKFLNKTRLDIDPIDSSKPRKKLALYWMDAMIFLVSSFSLLPSTYPIHILRLYLESAYFTEIENFLLKLL